MSRASESQEPPRFLPWRWLWRWLRGHRGDPDLFSRAKSFAPPVGGRIGPGVVEGYYIDFGLKARSSGWPPYWLPSPRDTLYVAVCQWGLGACERFLKGEGEEWLEAARCAGEFLVANQERDGAQRGAWLHCWRIPHTYRLPIPWASAMAQGEGASLLVRLFKATGDERYAESARLAMAPMGVPVAEGGLQAELDGGPFLEEYPTEPGSFVLNGGIFALWGCHDVAVALDDSLAADLFKEGLETLVGNLDRWDTGWWSLYDLFPHPVPNVASSAYHLLHTNQLRALNALAPDERLSRTIERFQRYSDSSRNARRAFARKVLFRLMVPRNRLLANRLPCARPHSVQRPAQAGGQ
jgi:heparosan-N-sulfate-glucuronate 5-epimerase